MEPRITIADLDQLLTLAEYHRAIQADCCADAQQRVCWAGTWYHACEGCVLQDTPPQGIDKTSTTCVS